MQASTPELHRNHKLGDISKNVENKTMEILATPDTKMHMIEQSDMGTRLDEWGTTSHAAFQEATTSQKLFEGRSAERATDS